MSLAEYVIIFIPPLCISTIVIVIVAILWQGRHRNGKH